MKKIAFVCTGNTCRSPMAEAFLKEIGRGNADLKVSSFGIYVTEESINEKALKSLSNFGIINYTHIPTQLTDKDIDMYDLILTMTKSQKEIINQFKLTSKVFSIGEFIGGGDIADPYGQDQSTYDYVARQIKDACDKIYTKIF